MSLRSVPPVRWVQLAVLLGLALRAYHYLRCPSVWHDEAALIVNILQLSFDQLLGPLLHAEAAPPLFLWAERAAVLLLGDGEYALRLVPFLAACLSVVLFAGLARRVLTGYAPALAVGLFAVSDRLLWHACEVKSYSVDVLVAVAAASWFARTADWPLWKRCLPLVVPAPVALWASYPACFVLGGLLLGLLPAARGAGWAGRAAYVGLGLAVGGAFLALAVGPAAAQRCGPMEACWTNHFPDWDRPWSVPLWAVASTLEVGRYCVQPVGQVLALFAGVGAVAVWRRGRPELVGVLLAPVGLALVAALLHKYPYGGSRLEVFAAPAVCLLAAEGVRRAALVLAKRSRVAAAAVLVVAAVPFGQAAFRVVAPWERAACDEAAGYVLANRADADRVVANHWEYEYYFRRRPDGWRLWIGQYEPGDVPPAGGRLWVVHTGHLPDGPFPPAPAPGWVVVETRDFRGVRVFVLHRPGPENEPSAAELARRVSR